MLGVGSGALVIPALAILCSFPQKSAQGTALAIMVPMEIVSFIRYKLNPDVEINLTVVGLLTIAAIFGALIGSEMAMRLPGHLLRKGFAVFLFLVAIKMFFSPAK